MAQINMLQVKELRDRTQAGLNDCRSALMESEGDMDKAVEIILKKGLAKSAKRAGAVATEGEVAAKVAADGKSGVIVEVNIQTDFASRNEEFRAFVQQVLEAAEQAAPGDDLGKQPVPRGSGTIEDARQALVGKLGENITVRRFERVAIEGAGVVQSYVHMGGRIGVLLGVETANDEATKNPELCKLAEDVAMQIAAMSPLWLGKADVPADETKKQSEIYEAQLAEEGKPEKARPGIITGKLGKWMKEVCLLEQQSVLDTEKSIDQVRAETEKAVGTPVKLTRFVRFQLGEGIEKPKGPDFATEVAKMAGG
jgi:elongation factor Ts